MAIGISNILDVLWRIVSEVTSSMPRTGKRFRFSVVQLLAATIAVGAAVALDRILSSPPLGSIGLTESPPVAFVLLVALWFCGSNLINRLGTYAVVASLLTIHFFLSSIGDWLFGHVRGPPQFTMAACIAGPIAVLCGTGWLLTTLSNHFGPGATAEKITLGRATLRWLSGSAVVLLTLLASLAGWAALTKLPRAQRDVEHYLKRRQLRAEMFRPSIEEQRQWAMDPAAMRDRPEIPGIVARHVSQLGDPDPFVRRREASTLRAVVRSTRGKSPQARLFSDPAAKAAFLKHLDDDDEVVRRFVAMTIIELGDQADREDRLRAIEALGVANEPAAIVEAVVTLLRVIDPATDGTAVEDRRAAIRSLGRMGSVSAPAVPRLAVLLEQGEVAERSAAAEALGAIGPPARPFVASFGRAWQKRRITLHEAHWRTKLTPQPLRQPTFRLRSSVL